MEFIGCNEQTGVSEEVRRAANEELRKHQQASASIKYPMSIHLQMGWLYLAKFSSHSGACDLFKHGQKVFA